MSVAPRIAAPTPAPVPQQHTFLESILYHLLPGVAVLLCMLLLAALLPDWPLELVLYASACIGVVPVQLGILYYHGYRRNGRLSLDGIVLYRERIGVWKVVLWALGTFLWAGLAFTFAKPHLNAWLLPAFQWLPPLFQPLKGDLTGFSYGIRLTTALLGLIGTCWVAPAVEELYFRGFLLPRMERMKGWAPAANAVLFSLYHLFTPWENLTRIVAILPMLYAVQRNRSIWISMLAHTLLNTVGMVGVLFVWLG